MAEAGDGTVKPIDIDVRSGNGYSSPDDSEGASEHSTARLERKRQKSSHKRQKDKKSKKRKLVNKSRRESSDSESNTDSDSAPSPSFSSDSSGESVSESSESSDASVKISHEGNRDWHVRDDNVNARYARFDLEDTKTSKILLPDEMANYVGRKFSTFVSDKVLNEKILDDCPVPANVHVGSSKVDEYVPELFSEVKRSYGKPYDQNLQQIQGRIGMAMGPLSKLWLDLEKIAKGQSEEDSLNVFDCLSLVEKSITLVGQAHTSTTYHRRMNVLYNLTKDVKKAKSLLKNNESRLSTTGEVLFGKQFYKALHKAAKIKRKSKVISKHLGVSSGYRHKSKKSRKTRRAPVAVAEDDQPFQDRAPS